MFEIYWGIERSRKPNSLHSKIKGIYKKLKSNIKLIYSDIRYFFDFSSYI